MCWHKWGKWSDPRETVMGNGGDIGWLAVCQLRICDKCGIADYRKLPEMRSIKGIEQAIDRQRESVK